MSVQYLSVSVLDDNLSRYCGRRVQLKLKESSPLYKFAPILTCVAHYYDEHAIDDEEENEFMGYGMFVNGVEVDGKPTLGVGSIAFADIAGFLPLEGENTEEEIDRIFSRSN